MAITRLDGGATHNFCPNVARRSIERVAVRKGIKSFLRMLAIGRTGLLRRLTLGDHLGVPLVVKVSTVRKGTRITNAATCPADVNRTSVFSMSLIRRVYERATIRVHTANSR